MIDAPPLDAMPPPSEPVLPVIGFMVVPSLWAMGLDFISIRRQARRDLGSDLMWLYQWPCVISAHWLKEFEACSRCAGVCVLRDQMQPIPHHAAQVMDFFFGRDKREAVVYEWQPFEKIFRLIDRDYLNLRRK